MAKTFYITTPIYYSSGKPHIGHAYTTLLADVFKRYKELFGYETFFVTGMDEHGQKIAEKAKENHLSPKAYVDQIKEQFLHLWKVMKIDYSYFVRTTDTKHIEIVQKIFTKLLNDNQIYLDFWKGLYCISCEENYSLKDVVTKPDGTKVCTFGHPLVAKEEESYFYHMRKKAAWLKEYLLTNKDFIQPKERVNELINNFINNLEDLSISRTSFDWGIQIKENKKHIIYVWLDALMNYLTSIDYMTENDHLYQKFWNDKDAEIVHLMSKEIMRFHCIYWPIFLHDLGVRLPTKILSHGWIITKEGKMSKSLGNVIDPLSIINKFGVDAFRYYLLSDLSMYRDSVFSIDNLIETFNTHLANNFGNMVTRTIGMLKKYTNGIVPPYKESSIPIHKKMLEIIHQNATDMKNWIEEYHVDKALLCVQNILNSANKYIEDLKPWDLFKNNQKDDLDCLLNNLVKVIETASILLKPVLVEHIDEIIEQMNFDPKNLNYDAIFMTNNLDHLQVKEAKVVYQRINNEVKI
ncbi:methionine--tRNA ligase [Ureaplasma canigenitalium]|uniref:methionine--tRNA ligase n=1 Tax=Ureaplasma canigenitalium TaxID=42092 RepID=UPI0004E1FD80|nr:methionine--tRNA ligase [Ureaplasma canigenitalium]